MHIEVDVQRPLLTLALLAGVVWAVWSVPVGPTRAEVGKADQGMQGNERSEGHDGNEGNRGVASEPLRLRTDLAAFAADGGPKSAWVEREILERKEEIIRFELRRLEEERRALGDGLPEEAEEEFREAARTLTGLLRSERALEQFLAEGLKQMLDAREFARSRASGGGVPGRLLCPIEQGCFMTAPFGDAEYERTFGFDHTGADFRSAQGSPILAAADGTVVSVVDNGLGFNSLTIEHDGGFTTLYGHVSAFHVSEGERVRAGDLIAESGGLPGTPGAGLYTTGSHLHFEVYADGKARDPVEYLPAVRHVHAE